MSSNPGPVLLPLTEFLTQQITTLYQSNVQKTIVNNLNNFVSADAAITINGRSSCLDGLASQIQSQTAGEAEATVTVAGVVEAPSAPDTAATVIASYFYSIPEKLTVTAFLGWYSRNFCHRHYRLAHQSPRCGCKTQDSHLVCYCQVCFML